MNTDTAAVAWGDAKGALAQKFALQIPAINNGSVSLQPPPFPPAYQTVSISPARFLLNSYFFLRSKFFMQNVRHLTETSPFIPMRAKKE